MEFLTRDKDEHQEELLYYRGVPIRNCFILQHESIDKETKQIKEQQLWGLIFKIQRVGPLKVRSERLPMDILWLDIHPLLFGDPSPIIFLIERAIELKVNPSSFLINGPDNLNGDRSELNWISLFVIYGSAPLLREARKFEGDLFTDPLLCCLNPGGRRIYPVLDDPDCLRPVTRSTERIVAKLGTKELRLEVYKTFLGKLNRWTKSWKERAIRRGLGTEEFREQDEQEEGEEAEEAERENDQEKERSLVSSVKRRKLLSREGKGDPKRAIPHLNELCGLILAAQISNNQDRKYSSSEVFENVPDEVLALIGQQFRFLHQPDGSQAWIRVVERIPRLFTVMSLRNKLEMIQMCSYHHLNLSKFCPFTNVPLSECLELIPVFEKRFSFTISSDSPVGSQVGIIFPEHHINRMVGTPSICNQEQFLKNLEAFSRGQLRKMNWANIILIGGAMTTCLEANSDDNVGNVEYFSKKGGEDIDLCLIGIYDQKEKEKKVKEVYQQVLESLPDVPVSVVTAGESITFVRHFPFRSIQIMGAFGSVSETLASVDIDCCAMAFDGTEIWATHRCRQALNTRMNLADPEFFPVRGCPHYERRLLKYEKRGFSIGDLEYYPSNTLALEEPDPTKEWVFCWSWEGHTIGYQTGKGQYPGVGRKLLLLSEKFTWVKERLLQSFPSSIPFGPLSNTKTISEEIAATRTLIRSVGQFDSYTQYWVPPKLTTPSNFEKTISELRLTNSSRPHYVPLWDYGTNPSILLSDFQHRFPSKE